MKPCGLCAIDDVAAVAPHVGAWIETVGQALVHHLKVVAPHVGAWIETDVIHATRRHVCRPPRGGVD